MSKPEKPTLAKVRAEIRGLGSPERASHSLRFFKTGPGQYGEGDKFLGLTVPEMRKISRKYRELGDEAALQLLESEWHEERLVALLMLVDGYERGDDRRRMSIHRAYLSNAKWINNWDLVDLSAAQIVGRQLDGTDISLLEKLARSKNIWERRIAIVSTFAFLRRGEIEPTLTIAERLLSDTHDLIHKAVGWLLREAGKRDRAALDRFLQKHYDKIPRTALRYAIERHPPNVRKKYLAGTF